MPKYLVNEQELIRLVKDSEYMAAYEQGGVDNWTYGGDSIENYFNNVEDMPTDKYGDHDVDKYVLDIVRSYPTSNGQKRINCGWEEGQECYYENNRAEFVKAITQKYAIIVVEAVPEINLDGSNFCTACQVGDCDGAHPTHTCEDAQEVIDIIQDELEESPTMVPVTVEISKLREKPIIIDRHEKEVAKLEEKKKEVAAKTKDLLRINSELEAKIEANRKMAEQLAELGIDGDA